MSYIQYMYLQYSLQRLFSFQGSYFHPSSIDVLWNRACTGIKVAIYTQIYTYSETVRDATVTQKLMTANMLKFFTLQLLCSNKKKLSSAWQIHSGLNFQTSRDTLNNLPAQLSCPPTPNIDISYVMTLYIICLIASALKKPQICY